MPRLAANLSWLYTERSFPDRFAAAAASGFTGIECLFPYAWPAADVADWLAEAGVAPVLFNLPPGDWDAGERGLAALPGNEARFAATLDVARRYADVTGVRCLHAMAGLVPDGADPAALRATYVANLRLAARALAADGRTLLIEPLNPRDMPGYAIATLEEALAIVAAVGEPNLKVQADLYHLQIISGDLIRRIAAALPSIGHVQLAGVPAREEPDAGEMRHEALFDMLDMHGYAGWVGCEYRPRGRTEDGLGWAEPWLKRPVSPDRR